MPYTDAMSRLYHVFPERGVLITAMRRRSDIS
jgi:hypothetical protein